ncbi:MAG TPA: S8 family serine peptidase [Actinomycetota bacterium]|nr:S8 family serine peptidase [Actinomycetota bacterium]
MLVRARIGGSPDEHFAAGPHLPAQSALGPQVARGQTAAAPSAQAPTARAYRSDEVVVRYRDGIGPDQRRSLRAQQRLAVVRRLPVGNAELVRLPEGRTVDETLTALRRDPNVEYAEPNFLYRATATPDDPYFEYLWGLQNRGQRVNGTTGSQGADIAAVDSWAGTTGSSAVTVAVVDTGVATDHPDLEPNMWTNTKEPINGVDDDGNGLTDDARGWDWVDGDNDASDMNGHGTHVAGTIAARGNNGRGISGVAWEARIVPLRVLNAEGSGTSANIAAAFTYAGRMGIPIVNASLGGGGSSRLMLEAITGASNTLFVVAAGNATNNNDISATYPCNYASSNLLCVAATDQSDRLASFSNFGATTVHLAAPGVNILSTLNQFGSSLFSDNFESAIDDRWIAGGTNPAWGRTTEAAQSPSYSVADTPNANYTNNSDTWLAGANALDLTGKSGCRLTFALLSDTQADRDIFSVEAATARDGTWTRLFSTSGSTAGRFVIHRVDISKFAGKQAFVRFRLQTDASVTAAGVAVDDVALHCLTAPSADRLAYLSGTSMATPHVAGAAALVLSARAGTTPERVKRALIGSVDPIPALDGFLVSGGRLDVQRALEQAVPPEVEIVGTAIDRPFQLTSSFPVGWQPRAADDVTAFDVRSRRANHTDGFGAFVTWLTETADRQATFPGELGYTYCFSARAATPEGPWSTTPACTAVPLNDSSLTRSGSWSTVSSTALYGGRASATRAKGARLTTGVTARSIALVATRCSGCGTVDVYLGSTRLRRISLAATTTLNRQLIAVTTFTSARTGTLSIRVVSSNSLVRIEGLGVKRV